MGIKQRKKFATIFLEIVLIILLVISLYPLLLVFFNSITDNEWLVEVGNVVWPVKPTLAAYKAVFEYSGEFFRSLANTVITSVGYTVIHVVVSAMMGYVLLRDDFKYKGFLQKFMIVTMYAPTGGIVSSFIINVNYYHYVDNWLAYFLPAFCGGITVFLFRTGFRQVPKELLESARIDGASDMQVLGKILIPMSKAFIATQAFLTFMGRWKEYNTSMYYMRDSAMWTVEYYTMQIVKDLEFVYQNAMAMGADVSSYPTESIRFALVMIAMIPLVLVFPLVQKSFNKGMVIGSVKG